MKKHIIMAAVMAIFLFVGVGITANAEELPEELPEEYTSEHTTDTAEDESDVEEYVTETLENEATPTQEWESFPIDLELNPPPGTGTVVDEGDSAQGTEFFTIMTEAGNTFYLIIDRRHGQENVYFLNAVTEQDLYALAGNKLSIQDPQSPPDSTLGQPVFPPNDEGTDGYTPDTETPPDTPVVSNITHFIIIGIAVVGFGIGGWYFKIYKPKKVRQSITEYEDEPPVEDDYDAWDDDLEDNNV
jgi:hypothetical protein